jgi:hypothetical protein
MPEERNGYYGQISIWSLTLDEYKTKSKLRRQSRIVRISLNQFDTRTMMLNPVGGLELGFVV